MTGRAGTAALLAAGLLGLAACVPLPMLPHDIDLRTNIAHSLPIAVTAGRTSRADLMLALGEPDGTGPREDWMAWTAGRATGGVLAIFAAPGGGGGVVIERVRYRRLLAWFDSAGFVTASRYDERNCTETSVGSGQSSTGWVPCVGWAWLQGTEPDALP